MHGCLCANDTITSKVVSYNISSNFFDTTLIPPLPQKLANGFGFTLGDSMYYGGGYTQAWTDQTSPVSDTLFDISYPTSSTGFIGTKGRVLRTTNNGTVWSNIFLDTNRNIVSVDFTSGTNGYAVASRDTSIIFRTTNTGNSWAQVEILARLNQIDFADSIFGWTGGNGGTIYRSSDGGASWGFINTGTTSNINSVSAVSTNMLWAACDSGKILRTTNAGSNWSSQNITGNKLKTIKFVSSTTGFAGGEGGAFFKTTDGGLNWSQISLGVTTAINDIEYVNNSVLAVVGENGNIFCTEDLGTTWVRKRGVTGNTVRAIGGEGSSGLATIISDKNSIIKSTSGVFDSNISNKLYKLDLSNPGGGWVLRQDLPIPIAEVSSSSEELNDSLAYLVGGKTSGNVTTRNVYRYNSMQNQWTACTPLPDSLSQGGMAIVTDTTIFFAGGKNYSSISNKLYAGYIKIISGQPDSISWTSPINYPGGALFGIGSSGNKSLRAALFVGGSSTLFPETPVEACYLVNSDFKYCLYGIIARPIVTNGDDPTGGNTGGGDTLYSRRSLDTLLYRFYFMGGITDSMNTTIDANQRVTVSIVVSITTISNEVPGEYNLKQNYPNPFNPSTTITYEIPESGNVTLKLYDITGKEVAVLVNENQKPGTYSVKFFNINLASGIYIYSLQAGNYKKSRYMALIK